jgi:hypothetical protein
MSARRQRIALRFRLRGLELPRCSSTGELAQKTRQHADDPETANPARNSKRTHVSNQYFIVALVRVDVAARMSHERRVTVMEVTASQNAPIFVL